MIIQADVYEIALCVQEKDIKVSSSIIVNVYALSTPMSGKKKQLDPGYWELAELSKECAYTHSLEHQSSNSERAESGSARIYENCLL